MFAFYSFCFKKSLFGWEEKQGTICAINTKFKIKWSTNSMLILAYQQVIFLIVTFKLAGYILKRLVDHIVKTYGYIEDYRASIIVTLYCDAITIFLASLNLRSTIHITMIKRLKKKIDKE